MSDRHLPAAFESALSTISAEVRDMGALVESMVQAAMRTLGHASVEGVDDVLAMEAQANRMEVRIDHDLSTALVRWQPTASDLRFLLAVSKVTSNLERIGDQAAHIARAVHRFGLEAPGCGGPGPVEDITDRGAATVALLHAALDAFTRRDVHRAMAVLGQDDAEVADFDGLLRRLVGCMIEDPHRISSTIGLVAVAKSIESVADHARNIAEEAVFLVDGIDVRHAKNASEPSLQAGGA